MCEQRDLLEVLKFELQFLEKGGYGRSPREPWRAPRIFEDSPTCLNHALPEKVHPCSECELMQLVPEQDREKAVPCDHIPLNENGETVDSLYRYATQAEIEEVMKDWLRATVARMEHDNAQQKAPETRIKTPSIISRCANYICPETYGPHGGGQFFRFAVIPQTASAENSRGLKHYWLCAHCSLLFTLVNDSDGGPVLKLRWKELPDGGHNLELSAPAKHS